jgi:antitoxin (DNA-binding transcriptional repressor) of toxin-antitoxin stability system
MSSAKKISATEAARSFSDVVSRVRYQGEEFIVEKGGEAVCRISPVGTGRTAKSTIGDFLRLLEELPPVDDEYRKTVLEVTRKQGKTPRSPWES